MERTEEVDTFKEPRTYCNNYPHNDFKTAITLAKAENRWEGPGAATWREGVDVASSHEKGFGDRRTGCFPN